MHFYCAFFQHPAQELHKIQYVLNIENSTNICYRGRICVKNFEPTLTTILTVSVDTKIVISADTTDTFKRRLDKFWQHQDILYDYKVELIGVRNRSQINMDDNFVI